MKTLRHTLFWLGAMIAMIALASPGMASTVSFGDNSKVWDTYDHPFSSPDQDYLVLPDLLGGSVTGHRGIDSLTVNYLSHENLTKNRGRRLTNYGKLWDSLNFGDIFINTNPSVDTNWDIVVKASSSGTWNIYSVNEPLHNWSYEWSHSDMGTPRLWHPIGINLDRSAQLIGTATYSGWVDAKDVGSAETMVSSSWIFNLFDGYSWNFTEDYFVLGLAVTCANDVLFERIPVPSPEPSTWVLFGVGLAGILLYTRRNRQQVTL